MRFISSLRMGLRDCRQTIARRPGGCVRSLVRLLAAELERVRHPRARPKALVANGDEVLAFPETAVPAASVIIPVFNHPDLTRQCLRSVAAARAGWPFEVIVVDDASTDAGLQSLQATPGLVWVRNDRNLGFVESCNAGAARARGSVLVFLNNDTLVAPKWLDHLMAAVQQPGVGLAGARLQYPDGRLQEAGGLVFADGSAWNYGRFAHAEDPRYCYTRDTDYCSGAAVAIHADLFRRLGGFERRYVPAYYEDTDLAMSVRAAGLRVIYEPAATVVHLEGASAGTDPARGMKAHQRINATGFADKWRDTLETDHPATGTDPDLAVRCRARARVVFACGSDGIAGEAVRSWLGTLVAHGCAVDLHLLCRWNAAELDLARCAGVCVWTDDWRQGARWHWWRTAAAGDLLLDDGTPAARNWTGGLQRDAMPGYRMSVHVGAGSVRVTGPQEPRRPDADAAHEVWRLLGLSEVPPGRQ